jgi:enamine deaminase RidA (YjgF/YER057c/UK114 family)
VQLFPGAPYEYTSVAPEGSLVFTAGACPLDDDGNVVASGDHEGQARQALANLSAALGRAGSSFDDVLKTTVYVVAQQQSELARVWKVVEEAFAPARPPSTLLGVSILGYRDQLVEIEAVAVTRRNLPGSTRT